MPFRCKVAAPFVGPRQQGAVLAASLLVLLAMTLFALAASQVTRNQAQVASNIQDRDAAFQAAEAALRAGERLIDAHGPEPASSCRSDRCQVYDATALGGRLAQRSAEWWQDHGWAYSTATEWIPASAPQGADLAAENAPLFVIEEFSEQPDSLAVSPDGASSRRTIYRVTSAAFDDSGKTSIVLQSTVARRFDP
jgi:type IV pilus assembly protein PilX